MDDITKKLHELAREHNVNYNIVRRIYIINNESIVDTINHLDNSLKLDRINRPRLYSGDWIDYAENNNIK